MATRTAPHVILLPARPALVAFSVLVALAANLLPWSGAWMLAKPDFVALTLLYWCIHEPRRLGFTAAWLLGLATDIADATLFGQHALAYTVLVYAGIILRRRVLGFGMRAQMLHVLVLLALTDAIVLVIRLGAGSAFPGPLYFAAPLAGMLVWPPLTALLRLPRLPKGDPDQI